MNLSSAIDPFVLILSTLFCNIVYSYNKHAFSILLKYDINLLSAIDTIYIPASLVK